MSLHLPILAMGGARAPVVNAGSNVSGGGSGFTACGDPGSTGTPGASVSGGTPSYVYLWELVSAPMTQGPAICSNPAALNPSWSLSNKCQNDVSSSETWRLTVTDDRGKSDTGTILVILTWTDLN